MSEPPTTDTLRVLESQGSWVVVASVSQLNLPSYPHSSYGSYIYIFKHLYLISLVLLLICFWLHLYLYYVQLHILDKSILSHLNLLLLHFYIHNNYIFDYLQKIYLLLLLFFHAISLYNLVFY